MELECVIENAKLAVERLSQLNDGIHNAPEGACHLLVLETLTGKPSSRVLFGFQQMWEEQKAGIIRYGSSAASFHQLDDVIAEPVPGVPIIIEGPTHRYPHQTHCTCVMAGPDGRFIIVDTLLTKRYVIVHSSDEVLSWARDTFDLSTAQFCEVDVSHQEA